MAVRWTDDAMVESFVNDVRRYPCLYDKGHADYKNDNKRTHAWKEIAARYGRTGKMTDEFRVDGVITKFKGLKDTYKKKKKHHATAACAAAMEAGTYQEKWRFYNAMNELMTNAPPAENTDSLITNANIVKFNAANDCMVDTSHVKHNIMIDMMIKNHPINNPTSINNINGLLSITKSSNHVDNREQSNGTTEVNGDCEEPALGVEDCNDHVSLASSSSIVCSVTPSTTSSWNVNPKKRRKREESSAVTGSIDALKQAADAISVYFGILNSRNDAEEDIEGFLQLARCYLKRIPADKRFDVICEMLKTINEALKESRQQTTETTQPNTVEPKM